MRGETSRKAQFPGRTGHWYAEHGENETLELIEQKEKPEAQRNLNGEKISDADHRRVYLKRQGANSGERLVCQERIK